MTGDIIGECYIYLISRFASDAGKKAGDFYTPSAVSRLQREIDNIEAELVEVRAKMRAYLRGLGVEV